MKSQTISLSEETKFFLNDIKRTVESIVWWILVSQEQTLMYEWKIFISMLQLLWLNFKGVQIFL